MARQIIFHGEYFLDFYKFLDDKVKAKIQYVFELIKQVDRVSEKFLAPITGYDGLFEIRIEYQSNIDYPKPCKFYNYAELKKESKKIYIKAFK